MTPKVGNPRLVIHGGRQAEVTIRVFNNGPALVRFADFEFVMSGTGFCRKWNQDRSRCLIPAFSISAASGPGCVVRERYTGPDPQYGVDRVLCTFTDMAPLERDVVRITISYVPPDPAEDLSTYDDVGFYWRIKAAGESPPRDPVYDNDSGQGALLFCLKGSTYEYCTGAGGR